MCSPKQVEQRLNGVFARAGQTFFVCTWTISRAQLSIKATGGENKRRREKDAPRPTLSTQEGRYSSKNLFYLQNTACGLFIAVVQAPILRNLNVVPASCSSQVNHTGCFTEQDRENH